MLLKLSMRYAKKCFGKSCRTDDNFVIGGFAGLGFCFWVLECGISYESYENEQMEVFWPNFSLNSKFDSVL